MDSVNDCSSHLVQIIFNSMHLLSLICECCLSVALYLQSLLQHLQQHQTVSTSWSIRIQQQHSKDSLTSPAAPGELLLLCPCVQQQLAA